MVSIRKLAGLLSCLVALASCQSTRSYASWQNGALEKEEDADDRQSTLSSILPTIIAVSLLAPLLNNIGRGMANAMVASLSNRTLDYILVPEIIAKGHPLSIDGDYIPPQAYRKSKILGDKTPEEILPMRGVS